jgi:hypothetical protein
VIVELRQRRDDLEAGPASDAFDLPTEDQIAAHSTSGPE